MRYPSQSCVLDYYPWHYGVTYHEDQSQQLLQTRTGHIAATLREHRGKGTRGRRGKNA